MISNGKRWALRLALVTAAFAGGALTARAGHATGSRETPYDPLAQLARVLVQIENEYVDPVERQRILDGAIRGMVAELDPHSAYLSPTEFARFNEDTGGTFGGIGVEVDFRGDRVVILALVPGAPAARSGVKVGDEIVAVDGKPLRGVASESIVGTMRGAPGSRMALTVKRRLDGSTATLELVRERVHVRGVEGKRLAGDVAYVRIRQFQSGAHTELLEAFAQIRKAEASPLRGIVLDLRNNPGGLVDEAEAIADEFLGSGTIYSTRHRARVIDEARAHPGGAVAALPVAVLVNEFTASSSELLASALQENGRARVIGATTFGKGSVQTIYELPGRAGLRLTTMRYYTPLGHAIQARGVIPDVRVRYEDDAALPLPIVREGSLTGALGGESGPAPAAAREEVVAPKRPELASLDEIPVDPSRAGDVALSRAYREALSRTPPQ